MCNKVLFLGTNALRHSLTDVMRAVVAAKAAIATKNIINESDVQ